MKVQFTRFRILHSRVAPLLALIMGLPLGGCDSANQGGDSSYGTESHFLSECDTDSECGKLECLGGRCSVSCTSDSDCDELGSDNVCAPTPGANGRSCDAACSGDACSDDDVAAPSTEPVAAPEPDAPGAPNEPNPSSSSEPSSPASPSSSPLDAGGEPAPPAFDDPDSGTRVADAGQTTPPADASVTPVTVDPSSDSGTTQVAAERACATSADCTLVTRADVCCPTCPEPFSVAYVAANECLPSATETLPQSCLPTDCPDGCPGADCAETTGVVCLAGECTTTVSASLCSTPCEAGESCVQVDAGYACQLEDCPYDSCHPERCDQIGENCCDPYPGDGVNYCNDGLECRGQSCEAPESVAPERVCGTVLCDEGDVCCIPCMGSCVNALSGAGCPATECGETFACGPDLTCATATQYCERFTGGPVPDPSYTCYDFPDTCDDTPSCACLAAAGYFGPCTASIEGGFTVEQSAP